jgi:Spy/CpxP family protein refolding chaperone
MRGGHGNPDEQVRHITRAVGLTSEQQAQVRQIVQDRDAKMGQLQPGPGRREQMRSLAMDGDAKIRAILTDEQKPKFDAWRSEQMSKRQAMRQGGGGAPPPADGSGPPPQ